VTISVCSGTRSTTINFHLIVLPSDKNLGPCIIERTKYIQAALDHLSNATTYERLEPHNAQQSIIGVEQNIIKFLRDYHYSISKDDNTFLWQSLEVNDKYIYFYITAKVHKTPWKPRPITLTAGSITHGLGRWVDQELKPIVKKLPSYIRSSAHLLERLKAINYDPSNVSLFSCDTISMYTNINTAPVLEVLHPFLRTLPLCAGCQADAITSTALEIRMRQNVFKFGDTFWRQKSGTAMGTPPGANYAELYYGTWGIDFVDYSVQALPYIAATSTMELGSGSIIQTRTSTNSISLPFKLP
jgi:menaquinone-dependent protoporphyrinogen IX oxidase